MSFHVFSNLGPIKLGDISSSLLNPKSYQFSYLCYQNLKRFLKEFLNSIPKMPRSRNSYHARTYYELYRTNLVTWVTVDFNWYRAYLTTIHWPLKSDRYFNTTIFLQFSVHHMPLFLRSHVYNGWCQDTDHINKRGVARYTWRFSIVRLETSFSSTYQGWNPTTRKIKIIKMIFSNFSIIKNNSPRTVSEQLNKNNNKQTLFKERSSIGFLSMPLSSTSYHTSTDWVLYRINLVPWVPVEFQ